MVTPHQILRQYQRGIITSMEMLWSLMRSINQQNVAEFVASASPDLLDDLQGHLRSLPTTDEDWSNLIFIDTRIWRADVSEEQQRRIKEEEKQAHRRGVELLREYFARSGVEGRP